MPRCDVRPCLSLTFHCLLTTFSLPFLDFSLSFHRLLRYDLAYGVIDGCSPRHHGPCGATSTCRPPDRLQLLGLHRLSTAFCTVFPWPFTAFPLAFHSQTGWEKEQEEKQPTTTPPPPAC